MLSEYLSKCEIDTVSQGSNDQPAVQPHVLIAVGELSTALPHKQLIRLFNPVESQLTLPFELTCIGDTAHRKKCVLGRKLQPFILQTLWRYQVT